MPVRALVLLFACALPGFARQSDLDQAWNLASKGQRAEAVALLRTVVQRAPGNADAHLLLGSLLAESGDRDGALAQLSAGARLRPASAEAQNALAEGYLKFGDTKAARGPLERAAALNPAFAPAQTNLGMVLLDMGEPAAAAPHLERAIRALGKTAEAGYAHYLLARVHSAQNEPAKARAELDEAVLLRPDLAEAWSDLGIARKNAGDERGALAAFEKAVSLKPGDAIAQYRLGAEYLRRDQLEPAIQHLEQAYRLNPADQSTLNALQRALNNAGRSEEAAKVKQVLADLLRRKDEANQNALSAVRINNEGAALEQSGNMQAALAKYSEALKLAPEHVGIRVNYAVALLRLGQWTEGLTQLHEALERDPRNAQIKAALDDALRQAPPASIPHWSSQSPSPAR